MDSDGSQTMSFKELCQQLRRLDFRPPVHVTMSDFASITQDGTLCNSRNEMTPRDFELAMRLQLRLYIQVPTPRPAPADVGPRGAARFQNKALRESDSGEGRLPSTSGLLSTSLPRCLCAHFTFSSLIRLGHKSGKAWGVCLGQERPGLFVLFRPCSQAATMANSVIARFLVAYSESFRSLPKILSVPVPCQLGAFLI